MNIEKITSKSNIKLTTARKAILKAFLKTNQPMCYEDLKDELSMDKATFYRNILIFENENIISSFESNDRKRYFEIFKNEHSHFICTICSKIECIHEKPTFNLVAYKIENIVIKGICPNCLIKEKSDD